MSWWLVAWFVGMPLMFGWQFYQVMTVDLVARRRGAPSVVEIVFGAFLCAVLAIFWPAVLVVFAVSMAMER